MKTPHDNITALLEIMAALRTPQTGCPWNLKQNFASIIPYTIEESYEVADAIRRGDFVDLCEELGDLLLQVVYHARLAEEQGHFTFHDVVESITQKMLRRHPHIFGGKEERLHGMEPGQWQKIKDQEKQERHMRRLDSGQRQEKTDSLLDEITPALPPLIEATKLQQKAATVGFDWEEVDSIFEKLAEESAEFSQAIGLGNKAEIEAEYGDLLFTLLNLGRKLGLDPQEALGQTNQKFRQRFSFIEKELRKKDKTLDEASLEEMENLWQQAKTFSS